MNATLLTRILDMIFSDIVPQSVSKIKESKEQTISRLVGPFPSKLKRITI